ncbi:unnamed protein product [marine sediment metagenome]|uniref:Uncharacterized protein n=1 Tax=marine sediment metagenome TaxID=412755 RepID=X1CSV6_9ZZZZ
MTCECKRCGKVFEKFFCPECEELSIQKLAQIMEQELKQKEQNLTSRLSRAAEACPFCDCVAIDEMGHCEGCGKLTRPPPA